MRTVTSGLSTMSRRLHRIPGDRRPCEAHFRSPRVHRGCSGRRLTLTQRSHTSNNRSLPSTHSPHSSKVPQRSLSPPPSPPPHPPALLCRSARPCLRFRVRSHQKSTSPNFHHSPPSHHYRAYRPTCPDSRVRPFLRPQHRSTPKTLFLLRRVRTLTQRSAAQHPSPPRQRRTRRSLRRQRS